MIECEVKRLQLSSANINQNVTLSDNYNRLTNKPSINGITLEGNKTASELNLLSSQSKTYKEVNLGSRERDSFVLLLSNESETSKMRVGELLKNSISTAEILPANLEDGNYVFLLKSKGE